MNWNEDQWKSFNGACWAIVESWWEGVPKETKERWAREMALAYGLPIAEAETPRFDSQSDLP